MIMQVLWLEIKKKKYIKYYLLQIVLKKVIEEAKKNNIDLIITHHPLIFRKPSRIVKDDLQGFKIIELIKNDISLFSSHTNLDSVKGGINEEIVNILGFKSKKIIEESKVLGFQTSGIGRIVELDEEKTPEEIIKIVKEKLVVENLRAVIGERKIKKIAIINGSGQDYFQDALRLGADCIITGDTTYHFASDYKEIGLTIIDPGHFKTEWIVFLNVMKKIEEKFPEIEFIPSNECEDPYEFL